MIPTFPFVFERYTSCTLVNSFGLRRGRAREPRPRGRAREPIVAVGTIELNMAIAARGDVQEPFSKPPVLRPYLRAASCQVGVLAKFFIAYALGRPWICRWHVVHDAVPDLVENEGVIGCVGARNAMPCCQMTAFGSLSTFVCFFVKALHQSDKHSEQQRLLTLWVDNGISFHCAWYQVFASSLQVCPLNGGSWLRSSSTRFYLG